MKATVTSNASRPITFISRTDEEKIINRIAGHLREYKTKNYIFHFIVVLLGTFAILGSVVVSVYLDTESGFLTADRLKIIAIVSTVSLSLLSAFNMISKTNNYVIACDLIQVALFKYNAKLISLENLIETYDNANKIIGGVDFNYDRNFNGTKTVVKVETEDEDDRDEIKGTNQQNSAEKPAGQRLQGQAATAPKMDNQGENATDSEAHILTKDAYVQIKDNGTPAKESIG